MLTKIGLDLGYANITLSNIASEVYREPSVVLVDKDTRRVIAVGNRAASGEDDIKNGMLVRPFKNGLLYSADLTEEIIRNAIQVVDNKDRIRCLIALASDFLGKQEGEVFKMLYDAGVSECYSVNPAVASLIGAGYSPLMSAVSVNVGASSTEIAILHRGNVILTKRESIGGEDFDKAVKEYIFSQGDMTVSLLVARQIKERLGAVWRGRESDSVEIEGTLALTGNRVRMNISTEDIVGVFEKPLQKLLLAVANAVKKIPPECVEDIFENGIILSGGSASIYGLDTMMNKVFDIPVLLAKNPIDCTSKGLARINQFLPVKMKGNGKNITSQLSKLYENKTQLKR